VVLTHVETVGATVQVNNQPSLSLFTAANLTSASHLLLTNNGVLEEVAVPLLAVLNELQLVTCTALPSFDLPALQGNMSGQVYVHNNKQLVTVSMGGLAGVQGNLIVQYSDSLTAVVCGELGWVGGKLELRNLNRLDTLALPKLSGTVGAVNLLNMPRLKDLCTTGLTNYTVLGALTVANVPGLVTGDGPLLHAAGVAAAIDCAEAGSQIKVLDAESYAAAVGGGAVSSEVGSLLIAWSEITDAQLGVLLAKVERATGSVVVEDCAAITTLELLKLTEVGGMLQVLRNPLLKKVQLPKLQSVGTVLHLSGNGQLTTLEAEVLKTVGSLWLANAPYLQHLQLEQLQGVSVGLTLQAVNGLRALYLPALRAEVEKVRRVRRGWMWGLVYWYCGLVLLAGGW
jgi:hypothetical protein